MLYGRVALFLKRMRIVSPTSARRIGPRIPVCSHSGGRGLSRVPGAAARNGYAALSDVVRFALRRAGDDGVAGCGAAGRRSAHLGARSRTGLAADAAQPALLV